MTIIKKGYRLTVDTWENDGDNSNIGVVEGLTKPEAEFMVDFVKLFNSENDHSNPGIGNMYEPEAEDIERAVKRITNVIAKHATVLESSEELKYFLVDGWGDYAYELTLQGGEFFTRVLESFKVEYIPEDIHIQDVTKEFE